MTPRVTIKPFGELAEFRNGINYAASSRDGGDLAVIGVGDFQDNDRLNEFGHLERISRPKKLEDSALLQNGDLVFVRSNGSRELIGRCMVLSGIDRPVSHSGFTIRARLTSDEVSPEWIAYYFATGLAKRAMMRRGGGTNISNLTQQVLQELPIPVPSPSYQKQVLNVAEGLSSTIRLLDEERRVKLQRRRGLLQQLLSGAANSPQSLATCWISKRIGDLFEEVERPVEWDDESEYRLVSIRRRSAGMFLREVKRGREIKTKQLYTVRSGDIVISRMQVVHGAVAMVPGKFDGHHISGTYVVLVPKLGADIDPRYFNYVTQTPRMYHCALKASYGVHIEKMTFNPEWYLDIPISLPASVKEQRQIADFLDLVDAEIVLLEESRGRNEDLKRAVLASLLTGAPLVPR